MKIKYVLTEQLLSTLMQGKRVPGSMYAEQVDDEMVIGFRQYQRKGAKRRPDQTLLALPHGWIRKSAKRYRLNLSMPDNLGERRVGDLMASETEEARRFMQALQEVMNVV
ncbi:MAG: hypothetical protein IJ588_11185 [Prevotella sp.]|nr:hypothetical protein [Prevotella sp.]